MKPIHQRLPERVIVRRSPAHCPPSDLMLLAGLRSPRLQSHRSARWSLRTATANIEHSNNTLVSYIVQLFSAVSQYTYLANRKELSYRVSVMANAAVLATGLEMHLRLCYIYRRMLTNRDEMCIQHISRRRFSNNCKSESLTDLEKNDEFC